MLSFAIIPTYVRIAEHYDLMLLDGAPHSTAATLKIAQSSAMVILPTGLALDDLEPAVLLGHELVGKSIGRNKLAFALCRVGESESEIAEAREYISQAGFTVLAGSIPEKTAYRRASDEGRALTETRFASLNARSDELAQSIIDLITPKRRVKTNG
jgi:chromosome partitioning protein